MKSKIQKILCFLTGHKIMKLYEVDNGRSKWGDFKCYRCGFVDHFQCDYNIYG